MLKRTLQIGLGLLLLAGCRKPGQVVPEPPPDRKPVQSETPVVPPAKPRSEARPPAPVDQESSLTDTSGRLLTGQLGDPPSEKDLGVPIFQPSQITETDASAYRMMTNEGEVVGMSFATSRSQDEVRSFYEQTLSGTSWDAGSGVLNGTAGGKRVVVIIQPGATSAFEIQVWS